MTWIKAALIAIFLRLKRGELTPDMLIVILLLAVPIGLVAYWLWKRDQKGRPVTDIKGTKANGSAKSRGVRVSLARKGTVGGIARNVAQGWKTIQSQNPHMTPRKIAESYAKVRFGLIGQHEVEAILNDISKGLVSTPFELAWALLASENPDETATLFEHYTEWEKIMKEELQKAGLDPYLQFDTEAEQTPTGETLLADWLEISSSQGLEVDESTMRYLESNLSQLLSSSLAGAFVHKDVLYSMGFVMLMDSFFRAATDLWHDSDYGEAIKTFSKAKQLISWPTVLYGLGNSHWWLENEEEALDFLKEAYEALDKKNDLLDEVVPDTLPDKDRFLEILMPFLDTQINTLGFPDENELRKDIEGSLARLYQQH